MKRRINEVAYELELPNSFKIHLVFHVTLLKPTIPDYFPKWNTGPPEPVIVEGEVEVEVEAILYCSKRNNSVHYLIKWKGPEENSWEPESKIYAKRLIQIFKKSHSGKLAQLDIQKLPIGRSCQKESCTGWCTFVGADAHATRAQFPGAN